MAATEQAFIVEYNSNNSGGDWWLTDTDWKALEDAGWTVEWLGLDFCNPSYGGFDRGAPKVAPGTHAERKCPGHRRAESYEEAVASDYRWLGSIARSAKIEIKAHSATLAEGVAALWWGEALPGQDASDEGCNCCGRPHSFYARAKTEVPA